MHINYLAILFCGIASMFIGFIWYGPLFGKTWMQIMGLDTMSPEQKTAMKKKMGAMYFLQFILSLITASVLSLFINLCAPLSSVFLETKYQNTYLCYPGSSVVWLSLLVWFGFVLTTTAGAALWSGKPKKLAWKMFWIMASAQFMTFTVMGMILGAWK
jgi:hypothetical protein